MRIFFGDHRKNEPSVVEEIKRIAGIFGKPILENTAVNSRNRKL